VIEKVVTDVLHAELAAGRLVRGAQVSVFCKGRAIAEVAVGTDHLGERMRVQTGFCLYCCSKVPLFTAVLATLDSGRLSVDSPLGTVLAGCNDFVGSCTVAELLTQTGGVAVLAGPESRFVPDHMRRTAHTWLPESGQAPRGTPAYAISEVGWLAALLLEELSGCSYSQAVATMSTKVLGDRACTSQTERVAVTFQPEPSRGAPVPLLNEQSAVVRSQWNPSLGWYAPATALARYGAELDHAWHGERSISKDLVRYATAPQIPVSYDVVLGREASYGLGYWTDLKQGGFGIAASDVAFGHVAQGGTAFLFVDPERRLSVAGCMDLSLEDDTGQGVRRAPLVDAILAAHDG